MCSTSRSSLRAVTTILAVTIAAATHWSTGVFAEQVVKVPVEFPDVQGQFCEGFEVLIHAIENKEVLTIHPDGRQHLSGTFIVELTNLVTNETIVVNASGPLNITPEGNTLIGLGRGLLFGEAGFFGPGSPAELSLHSGQVILDALDFTILGRVGHNVDLCVALE
jgi:hypothetical protein